MEAKTPNVIENIQKELEKFDNNDFKVMFFVMDSKGAPTGSLAYEYNVAYTLKDMGYNVMMVHAEKSDDFVGVGEWLGEKFASLPHKNVSDGLTLSPADFLIIPDVYTEVMVKTKEVPCKRIALLTNFNYLTDMTPPGVTWTALNIHDCITSSQELADRLNEVFPDVNCHIIAPSIDVESELDEEDKKRPKNLMVTLVTQSKSASNGIVKPFFWKYPTYKFVSILDIRNVSHNDFIKTLQKSAITVWDDPDTDFGISALEAMACGNFVLGRVPENVPTWMKGENGMPNDSGIWYFNSHDCTNLLARAIDLFLNDELPAEVIKNGKEVSARFSVANQKEMINKVFVEGFFANRKKEMEDALVYAKNNPTKND